MKLFLIFLSSVTCLCGHAQTHQIDSLMREIKNAKDQSKIEIFNALSYEYSFTAPDKSIAFAGIIFALFNIFTFIKVLHKIFQYASYQQQCLQRFTPFIFIKGIHGFSRPADWRFGCMVKSVFI